MRTRVIPRISWTRPWAGPTNMPDTACVFRFARVKPPNFIVCGPTYPSLEAALAAADEINTGRTSKGLAPCDAIVELERGERGSVIVDAYQLAAGWQNTSFGNDSVDCKQEARTKEMLV